MGTTTNRKNIFIKLVGNMWRVGTIKNIKMLNEGIGKYVGTISIIKILNNDE